jgi:hypothetical protein
MTSRTSLDISQHKGYGKKLLQKAEEIAFNNGYKKIAVIAGVGVRNYYRKQGYVHDTSNGCFQLKYLEQHMPTQLQEDISTVGISMDDTSIVNTLILLKYILCSLFTFCLFYYNL